MTEQEAIDATRDYLRSERDFLAKGGAQQAHNQRGKEFMLWLKEMLSQHRRSDA